MNIEKISSLLASLAAEPENPEINWKLALEYHVMDQTASAISFYLRAAERTDDKLLSYECLLKIAACFDSQKNRASHVIGLYKHALCLMPERPEAYFLLSRFNERNSWFMESYVAAEQGLNFAAVNHPPLRTNVEYPGRYGLMFQKAVAAWWWGKSAESRKLFQTLKDNHVHELDSVHRAAVQNNLSRLGLGPESQAFKIYDSSMHQNLKIKFPGSEIIDRSYGQVYQDMFILMMLNGKKNGTYLEIGSADPLHGNNTALLEKLFGWTGVGIERDMRMVLDYMTARKNKIRCENALEVNYHELLQNLAVDGCVDYLQLDCEPSKTTYDIMTMIPFDDYKFAVITYEHDHYVDMDKLYRDKSRRFLFNKGYKLVVNDVSADGISSFEDWWVHPELVDKSILDKMMLDNTVNHCDRAIFI
jgi:hypothetical protein